MFFSKHNFVETPSKFISLLYNSKIMSFSTKLYFDL